MFDMDLNKFKEDIFKINSTNEFNKLSLELFYFQYKHNKHYKDFVDLLGIKVKDVKSINEIPFFPIELFKEKKILCQGISYEKIFHSSGTTTDKKSKHYIESVKFYEKSIRRSFEIEFKNIKSYSIFCLTPEYKTNNKSSLIHMCNYLIKESGCTNSGFYYNKYEKLIEKIEISKRKNKPFIIIGLSFLLLDFAIKHKINLNGGIVLETGGMKKENVEYTKDELYEILRDRFSIKNIGSEYSMTELLSQSYSNKKGKFHSPPWKKILIRNINNPLKIVNKNNITGGINIIDLANIHSCAFIATNDLGKKQGEYYQVLGRMNNSLIRGCNNLI